MLAQSSSAPQMHISVHARLFCLQVHRLEHLLTPHPHRTSSTTAVGAGDTRERERVQKNGLHHEPSQEYKGLEIWDAGQDLGSKYKLAYEL